MNTLHLRAETKPYESRTPLTPEDCRKLIQAGISVRVESSPDRCFADSQYEAAGAEIVAAGSWRAAGVNSLVLGLKELPESTEPLRQNHAYFAHCYKGQAGASELLGRFAQGGGRLFDLEYLVQADGRRVAAFGYWAGYVGGALGAAAVLAKGNEPSTRRLFTSHASASRPGLKTRISSRNDLLASPLRPWANREAMIASIAGSLHQPTAISNQEVEAPGSPRPRILVTGALGRSGRGAVDALRALGMDVVGWDLGEVARRADFDEIHEFDGLVHCVGLPPGARALPFITADFLRDTQRSKLRAIVDVTCDNDSSQHLLPVCRTRTQMSSPRIEIRRENGQSFSWVSIDHLPTLLPRESSTEFSGALTPWVIQLLLNMPSSPVGGQTPWDRALQLFTERASVA